MFSLLDAHNVMEDEKDLGVQLGQNFRNLVSSMGPACFSHVQEHMGCS